MTDRLTPEQRRRNMQAIKSKGSQIETLLGKALWEKGYRYRRNNKSVYGKPDFTLKKYKIAIFCDSEFWHGYNWEERKKDFKSNQNFWLTKIRRNIERDKEVNEQLRKEGWTILRFWGKNIKKNLLFCISEIEEAIRCKKDQLKQ